MIALGPSRFSASFSSAVPFAASRARVFLTTLYSTLLSRKVFRSFTVAAASMFLYPTAMAISAFAIFRWSAPTSSCFSVRCMNPPQQHVLVLLLVSVGDAVLGHELDFGLDYELELELDHL